MEDIPEWALRFMKKGTEIRDFGGRYYAYSVRCIYDKENKRARKITGKYLGVVRRDGIVNRSSITGISGDYEYGNIASLNGVAEKIVLLMLMDVLLILSRIWVYDLWENEILVEIPKQSKELVGNLNIDT